MTSSVKSELAAAFISGVDLTRIQTTKQTGTEKGLQITKHIADRGLPCQMLRQMCVDLRRVSPVYDLLVVSLSNVGNK